MIYHITHQHAWQKAQQQGYYTHPSLQTENFIHASTKNQVEETLQRYYKNDTNLVLLCIDETLLNSVLKYELATSINQEFPHIYGVINTSAIVNVITIQDLLVDANRIKWQ